MVLTPGHSDRELGEDTRSRASAFLQKPFGSAELVRVVREVLGD